MRNIKLPTITALAYLGLMLAHALATSITLTGVGSAAGSGGGSCSNSLDFSQACNSANLGVIL